MANANLLYANFNQDYSCVSVGTRKGYSITNCEPFGRVYTMNNGARGIVEMLFCTSLLALVGVADVLGSSPRKLQIVNTKRQTMICELLFPSSILAVKMNRRALVVVLETEIYIYDISNMRLLHVIETTANPEAICALSPNVEASYLAYPSQVPSPNSPLSAYPGSDTAAASSAATPQSNGDVTIFSTTSLTTANIIPSAHKSPLSIVQISQNGSLLATASVKGTVIRVWSVPKAEKLYQFRRGSREARIYSIAFNSVGSLMAVSSANETVHLFKLGRGQDAPKAASEATPVSQTGSNESHGGPLEGGYEAKKGSSSGVSSSLRRKSMQLSKTLTHSVGGYLPNTVTEMWDPSRDFAWLRLPSSPLGVRSIVGLSGTMPQIMVVSSEGYFYAYSIDLEKGGECALMKQFSLLESGDESSSVSITD
ncbi:autophagy protein [Pleurotus ostreatus]|uniref:Autophagy protein n=1 Tax=Pleurotus ostreatus TaxID=5322 RepID=A0A8H7A2U8_PLEOS|nr:autophagy protein [Pleurotus ostreatus]KAF7437592.1 autophagy protein [Pleurotus ostreatus]KAJ8703552.1 autophagy protein [Pleurotus ostreatus]